jgi:hypothetical protein
VSDLTEVIRLVETVRAEMREDRKELREELREINKEVKRTNGRVTILETKDKDEGVGKTRRQRLMDTVVAASFSVALSVILSALFLTH